MLRLVSSFLSSSNAAKSVFPLPMTIGRGMDVDVRVDDRWVSRRHCRLELIEDELFVRDLDSRHGVFLNGEQVVEALLKVGDRLSVGVTNFIVRQFHADALAPRVVLQPDGPVHTNDSASS